MKSGILFLREQQYRFAHPEKFITSDIELIYKKNKGLVGWPKGILRKFAALTRKNTVAIVGAALGDEGKGRFVDNKIGSLLTRPGIRRVYVVRFQGGNNAGHTVEKGNIKLALHQVPSAVLHAKAIGVMDRGMVIHPEDLQTEVEYVEKKAGSIKGKLFLSQDAICVTDIERAEELLNRIKQGKAAGGTGRGIGPAYAHHYDRLGATISDFIKENWQEVFEAHYDRYTKDFAAHGQRLADMLVPDLKKTKKIGTSTNRPVGTKKEFIARLASVRKWLLARKMVRDTFSLHAMIDADASTAVLFEGAQALGLHPWLGTWPDVTASDTSVYGVQTSTAYWRMHDVEDRIGIFKITYTSSVGARRMPTHIPLPKKLEELAANPTVDQKRGAYVREVAHEYGTTTGRPRDILHLDIPMITYNCRMSGVEVLAGTHLDIAREGETIKVCTHYTDKKGHVVPYYPNLVYLENVIPHYVELSGWDGQSVRKAKIAKDLPTNARKFLAFVQLRTGYPIVAATTGPKREHIVTFPGYSV